ncbi:hypothetical protein B2J93_2096 [Marssonina coronariae]|uniref:Uncharacterized protein n=1 Tax=Diplocarpon coronariae TaxID=2795749 RepID=A0A218Z1Q5_9HELO|nr:hypothetical protein B2J93_2096 [Marssonina coronariae]
MAAAVPRGCLRASIRFPVVFTWPAPKHVVGWQHYTWSYPTVAPPDSFSPSARTSGSEDTFPTRTIPRDPRALAAGRADDPRQQQLRAQSAPEETSALRWVCKYRLLGAAKRFHICAPPLLHQRGTAIKNHNRVVGDSWTPAL